MMANGSEIRYVFPGKINNIKEVSSFIRRNIGDMCYASSITDDDDQIVKIGIFTDEVVWNSETNVPSLRFQRHDAVFTGYFEKAEHFSYLVIPSKKEIKKSFQKTKKSYTERSESKILESIGSKILNISQIHNQMNPIFEIVGSLLYLEELDLTDFKSWEREKTNRYLNFLESLNILSMEGSKISPGNLMKKMDKDMSIGKMYDNILAQVVENGMLMMFYTLNMTHLHPFIKLTNVNCMTSLSEKTALKWDWKVYQYYMQRIYNDKRNSEKLKIVSKAIDLSKADIFEKEKNVSGETMFSCKGDIFNKYVESCRCSPLSVG